MSGHCRMLTGAGALLLALAQPAACADLPRHGSAPDVVVVRPPPPFVVVPAPEAAMHGWDYAGREWAEPIDRCPHLPGVWMFCPNTAVAYGWNEWGEARPEWRADAERQRLPARP